MCAVAGKLCRLMFRALEVHTLALVQCCRKAVYAVRTGVEHRTARHAGAEGMGREPPICSTASASDALMFLDQTSDQA